MKKNKVQASILQKILHTIDKFGMLERGDRVLVAFSGGPDSSALLFLLNKLKGKYDISMYAGHINHMLRGKESLEDEKQAKKVCRKLKILCKVVRKDIKKLKKKGESIEEAARRIRYEALGKIAKSFGANKIALGHNKNDQVETILFRIIRGTGEEGLSGIAAVRNLNPDIKLVRPLLDIWRNEIEAYLKYEKIDYRVDSSNLDIKFLRNKIRHKLIPELEKYNPQIKDSILRISQISRENSEYIGHNTRKILRRLSTELKDAVKIDLDKLLAYPRILRSHILREAMKGFKDITYASVEEIEKIIASKRANLTLRLSSGVEITKEYATLIIRKARNFKKSINNKSYCYVLKGKGKFFIPEVAKTIHIDYFNKNIKSQLKFDDSFQVYLDAERIKFPLILRTREKGDRFFPFGMKKEKKLKDFFIDEKIPLRQRDRIPILVTRTGKILWIVGYRRSNLGVITKETSRIIRIRLK